MPIMKSTTEEPTMNTYYVTGATADLMHRAEATVVATDADEALDIAEDRYGVHSGTATEIDGEPSEGELERIAENVSTPNWMRV